MGVLIMMMDYPIEKAFRNAMFQVVSSITTTGIFNDTIGSWPHITWIVMGIVMFLGACAGSTSGGYKCIRGVMTLKVLRNNFRQIIHPNAVLPVKINGQSVPESRITALFAFFTLFVLMLLVTTGIMVIAGIDPTNAVTIAMSCVSNVGPSLNEIGPPLFWADMADYLKWLLCLLMLMGRLEIMTVLVLFTHTFWKEN
jgi:trk system potassium uptake protein TrkH